MKIERINLSESLASLPPEWPDDPLPAIRAKLQASGMKIVVLDDDPTGTQTVHNIPVLTEWSVETLATELANDLACFYILTNSRSLPLPTAQALNREIADNLMEAARKTGRQFSVISRSDSTLRGHFPGEVDALAEAMSQESICSSSLAPSTNSGQAPRPSPTYLIAPFFLQGGRYTIDDVHYVADGEWLVPAGMTEFARDASFGYQASHLKEWVEEKTGGRVRAEAVHSVSLHDIRVGGPQGVTERLLRVPAGAVCIVNCASERDMAVFALGVLQAESAGQRYLARTAATFVRARLGLEPKPLLTPAELQSGLPNGGLVVVGSYVPKSSAQLTALLAVPGVEAIELDVVRLLEESQRQPHIEQVAQEADQRLAVGKTVVLYTSRQLVRDADAERSLAINQRVSEGLVATVRAIQTRPSFLIAKGGITSSDVATKGLNIKRAMVMGQLLPGVPVWKTGAESRYPGLVYVVFPGNVGGTDALVNAVSRMSAES